MQTFDIELIDAHDQQAVAACFPLFKVLRPHLDEPEFLSRVRTQTAEGYRIAVIRVDGEVAAAAGFRVLHFLWSRRMLYIDDLIADPAKRRLGLGGTLLDWLIAEGKRLRCDEVHVDTGFQRHDAHRLYLKKGFVLACHHMAHPLT